MVRFKASGRASGLDVDRTVGHLFRLDRGSVVRWDVHWEEREALEEAEVLAAAESLR